MESDRFMEEALQEARAAYEAGEYPIGSVIVLDGEIIGRGRNIEDTEFDPTGHAEVVAIREACAGLRTTKLTGSTLYTTIYPCPMCEASIIAARIEQVVFGGHTFPYFREVKWGKAKLEIDGPVLDQEYRDLFERRLRERGRQDIIDHPAR